MENMHPTIVQCMGVYIAHQTDCTTLEGLLGLKMYGMDNLVPDKVHSATAASAHIKYNGDHAVVTVGVIGRQTPMLPAFCDYFGLDPRKAKEVHVGAGDYITYQIHQSTTGINGTKLTRRRNANTATGSEVFAIWQAATNVETFELTGEFDFQIKTLNRTSDLDPLINKIRNNQWWNMMVDEMTKQKQRLVGQLCALTVAKKPKLVTRHKPTKSRIPRFVDHGKCSTKDVKVTTEVKPDTTNDDVKNPAKKKKITQKSKNQGLRKTFKRKAQRPGRV